MLSLLLQFIRPLIEPAEIVDLSVSLFRQPPTGGPASNAPGAVNQNYLIAIWQNFVGPIRDFIIGKQDSTGNVPSLK